MSCHDCELAVKYLMLYEFEMNLANPKYVTKLQNQTIEILLSENTYEYVASWWLPK